MTWPIEIALDLFLKKHYNKEKPVLLAFSGGPDSQALLHALLKYAEKQPLTFAVAHIDHRWRPESSSEALQLKIAVEDLGITYHEKVLDPISLKGNLEKACREARYDFFRDLAEKHGYQAVLTGHHRDDLAETVLKKIFEGSSLSLLSGISSVATVHGSIVWRPLLEISKNEILEYVNANHLNALDDRTNKDPRFLRARMRTILIPTLTEMFGKEIAPGLCHIGRESEEIHDFLEKRTESIFESCINSPFGAMWDLSMSDLHKIEIKFLLKKISNKLNMPISRDTLDLAAGFIQSRSANKSFEIGTSTVHIDRGCIFYMSKEKSISLPSSLSISLGQNVQWGRWTIQAEPFDPESVDLTRCCTWRDFWKGKGEVVLPYALYNLCPSNPQTNFPGTHPISKWWTNNKVPACLRDLVPMVFEGDVLRNDLLTGKGDTRTVGQDGSPQIILRFQIM